MDFKKQMHQAVCDKCGQTCEVPFKPTSGKPVLCSNCFGLQRDRGGQRVRGQRDRGKKGSGDRRMYKATCDECGQSCDVPFLPTAGKPIYCNECFSKKTGNKERRGGRERHGGGNDQVFQQLSALSSKLDRILSLLDSREARKGYPKKETSSKSAPTKSAAKKKPTKKAGKKNK